MDYSPYQRLLNDTLGAVAGTVGTEISRLGVAPFASDPETTLRPSPLMVVSMKPYGAAGRSYPNGWEERAARPGLHRWYDGPRAGGNFVREADLLLRETLRLLRIDLQPREVLNTYAYFFRAADARQLKSFGLEHVDCRDFHQHFVETIRPRFILCIGNGPAPSAYATYRELFEIEEDTVVRCAPRVLLRHFSTLEGLSVIGVPHLSHVRVTQLLPALGELLEYYQN